MTAKQGQRGPSFTTFNVSLMRVRTGMTFALEWRLAPHLRTAAHEATLRSPGRCKAKSG